MSIYAYAEIKIIDLSTMPLTVNCRVAMTNGGTGVIMLKPDSLPDAPIMGAVYHMELCNGKITGIRNPVTGIAKAV